MFSVFFGEFHENPKVPQMTKPQQVSATLSFFAFGPFGASAGTQGNCVVHAVAVKKSIDMNTNTHTNGI